MAEQPAIQSCVVVGAGIAGLLAARHLKERGVEVVLFDKGRKTGGRMATRHLGDTVFDYGAQFFTVRDKEFDGLLKNWRASGHAQDWGHGFPSGNMDVAPDGHPRYCGFPHMRALAERLGDGLDIRLEQRVNQAAWSDGAWTVATEQGDSATGDALLLTPPVPQALDLYLGSGNAMPETLEADLRGVEYDPCIAVMAVLDGPPSIPPPGGVRMPAEEIQWMADNHAKGISADGQGITIHANPAFSRTYYDGDDGLVTTLLLGAASPWLGNAAPGQTEVRRWRYSQPIRCYEAPCAVVREPGPVAFAGDGFGAPRVEGAALSGLAAARALLGD